MKLQSRLSQQGFSPVQVVLAVVIVGVIASLGGYVWHTKQSTDKTLTTTASSSHALKKSVPKINKTSTSLAPAVVLAPQTAPPVVTECSLTLIKQADGNAKPLFCPEGGINVLAWHYYAVLKHKVMALPANSSFTQVFAAMCSDSAIGTTTNVIESSEEQLAAAYNGWSFGQDPKLANYIADC